MWVKLKTDLTLFYGWNQKFLDYEIETKDKRSVRAIAEGSWNQKFLDYEIETYHYNVYGWGAKLVEIKSFSITRLKLKRLTNRWFRATMLKSKVSRLRDWNNGDLPPLPVRLDTPLKSKVSRLRDWNVVYVEKSAGNIAVEIKSFSITRLKLPVAPVSVPEGLRWNQKFLDYEIETGYLHWKR